MSIGPLAKVQTKIEAINLDVSRLLNWGKGLSLEFIVVDRAQLNDWRIIEVVTKGFDRIPQDNKERGDGSPVVFLVADLSGTIGDTLRSKDLHVRADDIIFGVAKVPPIDPNGPQVYTLTCKVRTARTNFDATKK